MAGHKLGLEPFIDATALVRDSQFGRYTEIGARTKFVESTLGDYSYIASDSDVIYTAIGKFCSIAAMTRISRITLAGCTVVLLWLLYHTYAHRNDPPDGEPRPSRVDPRF